MKKFLLNAFYFPPFPGVGVFRWAQLCKYLSRMGYEIHVITVDWDYTQDDTLLTEITCDNVHIHRIPSGYPHNLARKDFGTRLINGIRNKFFIHGVDKFYFSHDEAQHWGKYLLPYASDLIKKYDISVAIATGGPFFTNVFTAKLKENIPNLKIIQDFRDPWANDNHSKYVNDSFLKNEALAYEKFCLESSDAVVTVTEGVKNTLKLTAPDVNYFVVRNGYDPEKFLPKTSEVAINSVKTIAHIGHIGSGRSECCAAYFEAIRRIPATTLRTFFVGSVPKHLQSQYADGFISGRAEILGVMAHDKAMELLQKVDASLHFNARHIPEAASTKVYEYAAAHKPVFSLNFGGESQVLIEKNNWGISANPDEDDVYQKLKLFLSNSHVFKFEESALEKYSYIKLAVQYSDIIQNIAKNV